MDENHLDNVIDDHGMQDEAINISDVIEVIETDPDFKESSTMFNGVGEINRSSASIGLQQHRQQPQQQQQQQSRRNVAYVKIVEQPASKALRFRYECEGRSAGSIPGASSTPENKTFPSIQVVGYQGRAVVVVSCVTKDSPYRPHPHNLVGREGCKKGVCTMEISPETMCVTFSNLGIQCVKKKDIESALRVREEIKVDPFLTGFDHRNQPTSIDLNAVRLCFQVFLEGKQRGKFSVPLHPIVSEPIYDKKAMSDLVIVKLSDCNSYVDGGRKDIILLCEKVTKEDIQIRFYEEKDNQVVWEGFGDFQPSQVHKQTAICFRAPRYRTLDITEPVKVNIQLRRPSDGASSEPLPFEYLPLDSGRPLYWSFRRNLMKKGSFNLINSLLANDPKLLLKGTTLKNINEDIIEDEKNEPSSLSTTTTTTENVVITDKPIIVNTITNETNNNEMTKDEEKSFNELINQVTELDEIYSDNQVKLLESIQQNENNNNNNNNNELFDDTRTYSSLQLAYKNPINIILKQKQIVKPLIPYKSTEIQQHQIDINANKRENDADKPPLPPKRVKKIETFIGGSTQTLNDSKSTTLLTRSNSFTLNLKTKSLSNNELSNEKKLPPLPCSTLPNPKKKGFFSKLFGRNKNNNNSNKSSRETSIERNSLIPIKSTLIDNKNLDKSIDNISQNSSNSIRIPLKDDLTNCNLMEVDKFVENYVEQEINSLDLTEAEHYALYTTMAPHATQSEFDEMSCYYAPVEGGKIITNTDIMARLTSKT